MQFGQIEREHIKHDLWALYPTHRVGLAHQNEQTESSLHADALAMMSSGSHTDKVARAIALVIYPIQEFAAKQKIVKTPDNSL